MRLPTLFGIFGSKRATSDLPRIDPSALDQPVEIQAKAQVPSDPLPTGVRAKQVSLPSFLKTSKPNPDNPLIRADRLLANTDITTYRQGNDSRQMIRDFRRASPDLSAAVVSYIRTGITEGYSAVAKNMDGTVNAEATSLVAQIITRMNILNDYTIGFDDSRSVRSLSEVWAGELIQYGACAGELVLDKALLPGQIVPVSTTQIRNFPSSDGKKIVPKQFVAGEYYDLDIPTFFMIRLDEDLLEPYPISPIEPAIQAAIFSAEFMNDIRRIVKRVVHPRMEAVIDEEKFRKALPQDISGDPEKVTAYMNEVVESIKGELNSLNPEDVIVHFDAIGIEIIDHGNTNLSNEYTVIQEMADSKLSAGSKVLPTVLGHAGGTSNTASAEVLMFMKMVEGTVWGKLNEMYSKILTLAVRLLGQDVYVEFKYNAINLRPKDELESFYAMKQSRVLELLSLGFLSDEEAAIELTGHLPGPQFKPLSGTGFYTAKPASPAGDGYNGASNDGSTMNQKIKSDAPKNAKSKNGGKPGAEVIPLGI